MDRTMPVTPNEENPKFLYTEVKGRVSACVVTRNASAALKNYLDSLVQSMGGTANLEIIVVDNESADDTASMLQREYPRAKYIFQKPGVGFTKGINLAVSASSGEYILIATPSTEVIDDAIPRLVQYLYEHDRVGVVGPKILNPDGTTQYSSKKMPQPQVALLHTLRLFGIHRANEILNEYFLYNYESEEPLEVTSLTMSLLLTRRDVFEDVGFLDEDLFVWASDVDWCYKVEQSKWKQIFLPKIKVYHRRNSVSNKQPFTNLTHYHNDLKVFYRKHYSANNGPFVNFLWTAALQVRFGIQVVRYIIKGGKDYSFY